MLICWRWKWRSRRLRLRNKTKKELKSIFKPDKEDYEHVADLKRLRRLLGCILRNSRTCVRSNKLRIHPLGAAFSDVSCLPLIILSVWLVLSSVSVTLAKFFNQTIPRQPLMIGDGPLPEMSCFVIIIDCSKAVPCHLRIDRIIKEYDN